MHSSWSSQILWGGGWDACIRACEGIVETIFAFALQIGFVNTTGLLANQRRMNPAMANPVPKLQEDLLEVFNTSNLDTPITLVWHTIMVFSQGPLPVWERDRIVDSRHIPFFLPLTGSLKNIIIRVRRGCQWSKQPTVQVQGFTSRALGWIWIYSRLRTSRLIYVTWPLKSIVAVCCEWTLARDKYRPHHLHRCVQACRQKRALLCQDRMVAANIKEGCISSIAQNYLSWSTLKKHMLMHAHPLAIST